MSPMHIISLSEFFSAYQASSQVQVRQQVRVVRDCTGRLIPEVGSSSSSTEGLMSSSWPMLTRFLSPPLMPFLKKPPAPSYHGNHYGGQPAAISCVGPEQFLLASGRVTLLLQKVAARCMQLAQDNEGQTTYTLVRHDACYE